MTTIKFYSINSKTFVEIDVDKVKKIILNNGRPAATAIDPVSGTKM